MNINTSILIKSIVKPFYRQHAGMFIFLFLITLGAVGVVDGAGIFEFHYSLIRGTLKNPFLFLLVLLLWFLYAQKAEQFFTNILYKPEFSFLQTFSLLPGKKIYQLLIWMQCMILLPISLYAALMIATGIYLHVYWPCILIFIYICGLCFLSARWYLFLVQNPGRVRAGISTGYLFPIWNISYWSLFIRYIAINKKLLFAGIKLFSCGLLYLMAINQARTEYDLSMMILFFSLGILGHGVLIHQLRDMEDSRLAFYRSMPVSAIKRFSQYAMVYLVLLVPEILTLAFLTPAYLHVKDAVIFFFLSYGLLLFLNSLLLIYPFKMISYLKFILCLFLMVYISVLTFSTAWLSVLLLAASALIFYIRYYLYER